MVFILGLVQALYQKEKRTSEMSKKIVLFSFPKEVGKPYYSRLISFLDYFNSRGFEILEISRPCDLMSFVKMTLKLHQLKSGFFFISMPSFRNFWLFLIPGLRIILDIRDGWSIAMESGYGGTSKRKPFKAFIARKIEKIIIRRSFLTITCTNGLRDYLEKISCRSVLLIPNGVLDVNFSLINSIATKSSHLSIGDVIIFSCAGQFSEYGKDKVEKLLNVISQRYEQKKLKLCLIGSDKEQNSWTIDYFFKITNGRGTVEIKDRLQGELLYHELLQADYGLVILRNPDYEFGTKIYDYIALNLKTVNYFDEPNNFTKYFDGCLDKPFDPKAMIPEFRRSFLIRIALDGQLL